jgi:hypothetical protein
VKQICLENVEVVELWWVMKSTWVETGFVRGDEKVLPTIMGR